MPDFDDVVRIGSTLPEVTEGTFYGTPGLKVRSTGFCRMWSPREHHRDGVHDTEVLVVFCDIDEKEALIESLGGVVFSTPHYDGHGAMLVRLADVEPETLADLLEDTLAGEGPRHPAETARLEVGVGVGLEGLVELGLGGVECALRVGPGEDHVLERPIERVAHLAERADGRPQEIRVDVGELGVGGGQPLTGRVALPTRSAPRRRPPRPG